MIQMYIIQHDGLIGADKREERLVTCPGMLQVFRVHTFVLHLRGRLKSQARRLLYR